MIIYDGIKLRIGYKGDKGMIFKDKEHEFAYYEQLEKCNVSGADQERKALIYCLTLTKDCRDNFNSMYDNKNKIVTLDFLKQGWATSTDIKCIRLGFNLFNGGVPTAFNLEGEEKTEELLNNTPINIFCDNEFSPYFFEAVRIRFE